MGLFSRILALSHKPEGLLHKAETLLKQEPETTASFFEQFARDYGYSRFCLLTPEGSHYTVAGSAGIRPDSLDTACSTRDFWDGTLFSDDTDWLCIRGEKLVNYLQLFCPEDRNDIRQLTIRRVSNPSLHLDYIFLLPQEGEYDFYQPAEMETSLERINEYLTA